MFGRSRSIRLALAGVLLVLDFVLAAGASAHAQVSSQAGSQVSPQVKPKIVRLDSVPKTVLYVGNSYFYYNNSLHRHVLDLLRHADPATHYDATSATISGAPLRLHDVDHLLSVYKRREFGAVILADCSSCAIDPERRPGFAKVAAKDIGIVRKHDVQPVLFMTWAYADRPAMIGKLADVYTRVGNDNDALVIPAGLAFARAREQRPELALHDPDNSHPSVAGTYLAACVVLASVYRFSPAGNSYRAGLDDGTAAFLQEIARTTVKDYYGQ